MYDDVTGYNPYTLCGLKVLLISLTVFFAIGTPIITAIALKISETAGIVLAVIFFVMQMTLPLLVLRAILKKAHTFWGSLRESFHINVARPGSGMLRVGTVFYAAAMTVTLICTLIIFITFLADKTININHVSLPFAIGICGSTFCLFSWLWILPICLWAKLSSNTKSLCRQFGLPYENLIETGRFWVWGNSLLVLIFWALCFTFLPLRALLRAINRHDAAVALIAGEIFLLLEMPECEPELDQPYVHEQHYTAPIEHSAAQRVKVKVRSRSNSI